MIPSLTGLATRGMLLALACFGLWLFGNARYHSGQLAERAIWQGKTAAAELADLAHKGRVELRQAVIQQESSDDLKTKLADALARAAARPARLCHSAQSGVAVPTMPGAASAAPGASTAGPEAIVDVDRADDEACAVAVVKAEGWRGWWLAVRREP